jgi:hypothetical protein
MGSVRADPEDDGAAPLPARPAVMFNRWQENWSVLADPRVPRESFDTLKYLPLSQDPATYLSLGANVRERFEANDAVNFGVGSNRNQDYDISRIEVHADLRVASQLQVFVQLESDHALGKNVRTPVDQDRLDLEQGFLALTEPLGGGTVKFRVGRQQVGFDLQRFVSVRDGPNVRQSYDEAWVDYEHGRWRYISFYGQPVQNRDVRPFDDTSNGHLTYGGFRVERQLGRSSTVAAYYSRFTQDGARFVSVRGNEQRNILDLHFVGKRGAWDWDAETMNQAGRIAGRNIEAWAVGSLLGYTFNELWAPRLALQTDAASGNRDTQDPTLRTFNPLFPNGGYVTLAGYTGYVNFIHVKPSITVHPSQRLKLLAAVGVQWRESTADAVYTQPNIPVAGTAGRAGRYTGTYGQFRTDWAATGHVALALEVVHFAVGDALRNAGGHDSNYIGAEFKYGW